MGLEKLKDGRGKADESDPTEGDRLKWPSEGEAIGFAEKAALLEESLRVPGRE